MFNIFKHMTIKPRKKIRMVGEPGLPAHESKLRPLRQNEIDGKWKERLSALINKIKEKKE